MLAIPESKQAVYDSLLAEFKDHLECVFQRKIRISVRVYSAEFTEETIRDLVEESTGISFKQMASQDRSRPISDARHLYAYIAYIHVPESTLYSIAKSLNRKHHTTIMHAVGRITNLLFVGDEEIVKHFDYIMSKIKTNGQEN